LQQRYDSLLSSGSLRPDLHQQQLVHQLALLLQQLDAYSTAMADYKTERATYEV
jgi:hypothetical protein